MNGFPPNFYKDERLKPEDEFKAKAPIKSIK